MFQLTNNHQLRYAIIFSLATHMLVLTFWMNRQIEAGPPVAKNPIQATLANKMPSASPPERNASPPPPLPLPAVHSRNVRTLIPVTPVTPSTEDKTPVAVAASRGNDNSQIPQLQTSGGNNTGEPGSVKSSSTATGNEAGQIVSSEELSTYRLALGREASRLKPEYDRKISLIRHDFEGRVEMNIRSDTRGTAIVVSRSSGYPALDEQAVELIGLAVRRTTLPNSLQGRHFVLPVTLEFQLARQ